MNNDYCRVTAVSPKVAIGNVADNLEEHFRIIEKDAETLKSNVIVFPELSLTGYTCEDLFMQKSLQEKSLRALHELSGADTHATIIVGLPVFLQEDGTLRNCAAVIGGGKVLGIVPKTFLPNYREFYEARWFASAKSTDPKKINIVGFDKLVNFGTDQLFRPVIYNKTPWTFGVEICEDVWAPIPPSSFQALAGATVLFNLSASNETIGKSDYRRNFVKGQSGKLAAAYIYCSSGPTESTKDLVFGGHNIIGEGGNIIAESEKFIRETHSLSVDIDVSRLLTERASMPGTYAECAHQNVKPFRVVEYRLNPAASDFHSLNREKVLLRHVEAHPFVPKNESELKARCAEIFGIQTAGLAKRLERVSKDTYIGVSGGLDSTLALLVACKTYDLLGIDRKHIHGITMPGFGTTGRTKNNADILMDTLGISKKTVDICEMCVQTWKDMNYVPFHKETVTIDDAWNYPLTVYLAKLNDKLITERIQYSDALDFNISDLDLYDFEKALALIPAGAQDLIFENVQARVRTLILMSHGFVLGTGDLSELALGWCTYNGDHMSMYNVNCSIPKTLVKFLVKYIAENEVEDKVKACLMDIVDTPISPELLPMNKGEIAQVTEDYIGPYELHDFFLYNFMRCGFSPSKIMFLAEHAEFDKTYTIEEVGKWLKMFYKRFFTQQFKRDCVPDGPKVGSVSLSPRGDWRMPPDADCNDWINEVDKYLKAKP